MHASSACSDDRERLQIRVVTFMWLKRHGCCGEMVVYVLYAQHFFCR